jgi:hypothetical protein
MYVTQWPVCAGAGSIDCRPLRRLPSCSRHFISRFFGGLKLKPDLAISAVFISASANAFDGLECLVALICAVFVRGARQALQYFKI